MVVYLLGAYHVHATIIQIAVIKILASVIVNIIQVEIIVKNVKTVTMAMLCDRLLLIM
jgi:hypothetical protein